MNGQDEGLVAQASSEPQAKEHDLELHLPSSGIWPPHVLFFVPQRWPNQVAGSRSLGQGSVERKK